MMSFLISMVLAAESNDGNGFLQYQQPVVAETSMWTNFVYILSLLATFAFVLILAYLASRFLGKRSMAGMSNNFGRVISSFALGANKSIVIVEITGRYIALGVTEQQINYICDVSDEKVIEQLSNVSKNDFLTPVEQVFEQQIKTLQSFSGKFSNFLNKKG